MRKVNQMIMRKTGLVLLVMAAATPAAWAQINCAPTGGNTSKLSCLIPTTVTPPNYTQSNSTTGPLQNSFGFLTADIGGEISQIPLASPASGIIFTTDPTLHVPVPSDQSLGPILTQRADTIGRHKLYIASTYQYFLLEDVDGLSLRNLPAAFLLNSPSNTTTSPDRVAVTNGRIDLKVHQYVGYATFGLTSRIDVSVAVPVLRVDMRYTVNESIYETNGILDQSISSSNPEQATGIGDIVLAAKENVWKLKKGGGLAFGAEFRLPTGDAVNFLGSGTFGVKPFAAFTYSSRISPHFNVGYQFNGNTVLVTNSAGQKGKLPDRLIYSGGLDWRIVRRLTLAADILEQRVFNAPRAGIVTNVKPFSNSNVTVPSAITTSTASFNRTDGSIGIKLKTFGNFLVTGNLLVKLDQGGLRERLAPLIGLSYTF